MIHVAIMTLSEPSPEGETEQVFVSLDGDDYLPINRRPEAKDEERIAALFEGDGNFRPITFARNAMRVRWWPEHAHVDSIEHYVINEVNDE